MEKYITITRLILQTKQTCLPIFQFNNCGGLMKKTILLILAMFFGATSFAIAQEKVCVGIMKFTHSIENSNDKIAASMAAETVTAAFVKTKRFTIVDRAKMEALNEEKELQKTEAFIDGKVIETSKGLGAQYLISGNVNSAAITENITPEGVRYYSCIATIVLKVIDVSTSQVVASETISKGSGAALFSMPSDNPQDALNKAIKGMEAGIDKFVKLNFPVIFAIAEIQEVSKKGEAKTILIAGGAAFGLKKGDKLKVVELSELEVNGKKLERKKEIGELKIKQVEDDNFSICTVSSGGTDINNKFVAKAKLQIITKE